MSIFWYKILLAFNFCIIFILFIISSFSIKILCKYLTYSNNEIYNIRIILNTLNSKFNNLIKSNNNDWFLRKKENKDVSINS